MYGYLIASLNHLDEAEQQRYHAVYCGLCRVLNRRYGQISRFSLSYDMTFLILLLGSLYEPQETYGIDHCVPHPIKSREWAILACTDYAADISVAMAYHKCLDDWQDDRGVPSRAYAAMLRNSYRDVCKRLPRQCKTIEYELGEISKLEHEQCDSPDKVSACFGRIMGEMMVYKEEDIWADALRQFGDWLGRFIYIMDAACDIEHDRKHNSYNPLTLAGYDIPDTLDALLVLIGRATDVFERLPLERDLHLLRSVLYEGVWGSFNDLYRKENGPLPVLEPAYAETPHAAPVISRGKEGYHD